VRLKGDGCKQKVEVSLRCVCAAKSGATVCAIRLACSAQCPALPHFLQRQGLLSCTEFQAVSRS